MYKCISGFKSIGGQTFKKDETISDWEYSKLYHVERHNFKSMEEPNGLYQGAPDTYTPPPVVDSPSWQPNTSSDDPFGFGCGDSGGSGSGDDF